MEINSANKEGSLANGKREKSKERQNKEGLKLKENIKIKNLKIKK